MRYRALDSNNDYTFGSGQANFLVNSPETVAQAVITRLRLYLGEWFLDISDGTDWHNKVLGKYTGPTRDITIQARILETPGVTAITAYSSYYDSGTRYFSVNATISTIYGMATISGPI